MKGGDIIETIKQERGSKDCLACVAAMATQTTVESFKKYCDYYELPFDSDITFVRYLFDNGYMIGSFFSADAVSSDFKMPDLRNVDLLGGNSYIVVESKNDWVKEQGASHAIYWEGENKKLHDPDPKVNDPKLKDYKVIMCIMIVKDTNHQRWKEAAAAHERS